jgi:hypothetical protein
MSLGFSLYHEPIGTVGETLVAEVAPPVPGDPFVSGTVTFPLGVTPAQLGGAEIPVPCSTDSIASHPTGVLGEIGPFCGIFSGGPTWFYYGSTIGLRPFFTVPGEYDLTAQYSGDANYSSASASCVLHVDTMRQFTGCGN